MPVHQVGPMISSTNVRHRKLPCILISIATDCSGMIQPHAPVAASLAHALHLLVLHRPSLNTRPLATPLHLPRQTLSTALLPSTTPNPPTHSLRPRTTPSHSPLPPVRSPRPHQHTDPHTDSKTPHSAPASPATRA